MSILRSTRAPAGEVEPVPRNCRSRQRRNAPQEEDEILNIFVDICSLFRREPEVNHRVGGEEPSTEAYLFSYLRMLDTHGDGVPAALSPLCAARWRTTASPRWIAPLNWKSACFGFTSRTNGLSSRSRPSWGFSNGVWHA